MKLTCRECGSTRRIAGGLCSRCRSMQRLQKELLPQQRRLALLGELCPGCGASHVFDGPCSCTRPVPAGATA